MSRYTVEHNTQSNKKYWISFGWDCPLSTFFMLVEDDSIEDTEEFVDPTVLDIGSPFDTLYTRIDRFIQEFSEKLAKIGITDFELTEPQKIQLLDDMNGIGN